MYLCRAHKHRAQKEMSAEQHRTWLCAPNLPTVQVHVNGAKRFRTYGASFSTTARSVQAAFTPKELREVLSMAGVSVHIAPEVLKVTPVDEAEMKATRMKRRVYDILNKAAQKPADRLELVPNTLYLL